jgi:hypothetical protein
MAQICSSLSRIDLIWPDCHAQLNRERSPQIGGRDRSNAAAMPMLRVPQQRKTRHLL